MSISEVLNVCLACVSMIAMVLAGAYIYITYKNKNLENNKENNEHRTENKTENTTKTKGTSYTKIPVFDFMQFDKIEDNMIVQDGGTKYLMVVECEGVNYDLMSNMEKAAVEAGFVQFLNSLRYTIQIYTQTRTVNIEESITNYRNKLDEIAKDLEYKKRKQAVMIQDGVATRKATGRYKNRNCKITKFV